MINLILIAYLWALFERHRMSATTINQLGYWANRTHTTWLQMNFPVGFKCILSMNRIIHHNWLLLNCLFFISMIMCIHVDCVFDSSNVIGCHQLKFKWIKSENKFFSLYHCIWWSIQPSIDIQGLFIGHLFFIWLHSNGFFFITFFAEYFFQIISQNRFRSIFIIFFLVNSISRNLFKN